MAVVTSFENGIPSNWYTADNSSWSEFMSSVAYDGDSYAQASSGGFLLLNNEFSHGDTPISAWVICDEASANPGFVWGYQDPTDHYRVEFDAKYDQVKFYKNGSYSKYVDVTINSSTAYKVEVDQWNSNGWNVTVSDTNGEIFSYGESDILYSFGDIGGYVGDANYYGGIDYVKAPVALSTPSNLSTSVSADDVTISWDDVDFEDGYYLYRAKSSGSSTSDYTQIADLGANTTSYGDTGLLDGEKYYYRVSAYNTDGTSSLSNEANGLTALPAPSNLTFST